VLPPLFAGGVKLTFNDTLRLAAMSPVGGSGTVTPGTALLDTADAAEVPTAFFAVTLHAYDLPLVSPFTMTGLAAPVPEPATPLLGDVHDAV
jgi:hypothetical protein